MTAKREQKLKQRASDLWPYWRLVFDAGMDYDTVFSMTPDEVNEANAAYSYYIDKLKGETQQ